MRRLKGPFRRRSRVPPAPAVESSRTSTYFDALASVIKVLDVAKQAADGLPIPGLKAVISTIHAVLLSVEKSNDNQGALAQLEKQVGILNASVLNPLSECTEVPPVLEFAINNLRDKAKEAAKRCQERQRNRRRLGWLLLTDRDANELQGFANDIKDAVTMFKASYSPLEQALSMSAEVQQMIQHFEDAMFEKLHKIPHADGAGYDSTRQNAPVRCFEDTRTEVLKKISDWIASPIQDAATEPTSDAAVGPTVSDTTIEPTPHIAVISSSDTTVRPIYWMSGLAGIGKSTIARTIAEDAKDRKLLGASFFFSRQEKELSDADLFIPTIAYQLAQSYPEARSAVVKVLRRDPGIVTKSFTTQFKDLIVEPLSKVTSKPVVIVVDALDECDNSRGAVDRLLQTVVEHCTKSLSLRLLITSRPEPHIKGVLTKIAGIVLHEDIEQSIVSDDIRKYLHIEISRIPERLDVKVPLPWPSKQELDELVKKAGKLFIWAAMAVRFVGDRRARGGPTARLKTLLDEHLGPNSNSQNLYVDLDILYKNILSQAADGLPNECIEDMAIVIGTVIQLRSEMPLEVIAHILEQDEDRVQTALGRIQSIIPIPTDTLRPIQIYHPSFPDFITSRERCPDSRFYMDTLTHERRLALRCLDILNSRLSEGVETLLKPTEEVDAVSKDIVLRMIPQEVQYACRFWAVHVSSADSNDKELMEKVDRFSSTRLLRWVVSMCILDAISDAIAGTRVIQKWMDDSEPWSYLKERFYDTERMILANSDIISRHPAQLYYSALPFLPSDTYLARQYPAPRGCISVLAGRENSWTPILFTLPGDVAAFAPGGHMITVGSEDGIQIYNASNGLLNSSIERISSMDYIPCSAAFTEDGSGVVVVLKDQYLLPHGNRKVSYQIEKFDLVKQSGRVWRTTQYNDWFPLKLSEHGSYIAFSEHENSDARICIWKTDGSDDISIPFGCAVRDLDFAGESAHLIAVAAADITILSIPSGAVQRTLYHEDVEEVRISGDGSFLASRTASEEARLWSTTQGTLLATFRGYCLEFSHANRLYVAEFGGGRVYDPNDVTFKSFSLPLNASSILPTPDESQILIHTEDDIQVWSLRQFTDTRGAPRYDIKGIDLSSDASLLGLATETDIEIWDARIGQCRQVIHSLSSNYFHRPVAFLPNGEFIVSSSEDGIIMVDVRAGVLMPMMYWFSGPQGHDQTNASVQSVGVSFDSSKLAAIILWGDEASNEEIRYICVWDLSSGTLLHHLECSEPVEVIRWSWADHYLLFTLWSGYPRYLNTETFQEETLEHSGDRFQGPNHLYYDRMILRIRLSSGREGLLFSALPSHLDVWYFSLRGDRVCITSRDGQLLLLDTSGLEAYMEICNLQFEPEAAHGGDADVDDDDDTDNNN